MRSGKEAHVAALLAMTLGAVVSCGGQDAAESAGAAEEPMTIRIVEPADGAEVTNPFTVSFEVEGLTIVPAGEQVPRSGHHHLLVDVDEPAPGTPIPSIEGYLHYGQGQTSLELTLEPGPHRLIAVVGDFAHIPLVPNVADTVNVVVR